MATTTTQTTGLGDHTIPQGTSLIISPYLLHHRPDLYSNPQRFDPQRPRPRTATGTLIPFGNGPRKCMGDVYAMYETVAGLATIAQS